MQFTQTIGHQKQKEFFRRACENGRLGHAYALCGPEHVGKTTFARELAGLLGADPILDVVLSDGEQGLSTQEARDMQSRLNRTAVRKIKVAIVAYAEKMGLSAANSILKLLEEPPAHSLLLLVTSNFHMLLPTVASRLQRVNFGGASAPEVSQGLAPFNLPPQHALQIIELSAGRIGIARRLAAEAQFYDFFTSATRYYQILQNGSLVDRLNTARTIAMFEDEQQNDFLKFAAARWISRPEGWKLGQKIFAALRDLELNINSKLAFDCLFLP